MKIVVIGKNSYIGKHCAEWIRSRKSSWKVVELGAHDGEFKNYDFSGTDAIIHTAGIVHRKDIKDWDIYKSVNADLTIELAKKVKKCGVKQFIFLSTMSIYGGGKKLSPNIINDKTIPNPTSFYGKSKYLAEQGLYDLDDETFTVSIVRPPNVYGKSCRGGYITGFESVVRKLPIIPVAYQDVKQSMIYIDNLSELIFQLIQDNRNGVFCPQDDKSVSAVELMQGIADGLSLSKKQSKVIGALVPLFFFVPVVKKAYGGIEYDSKLSKIDGLDYQIIPFCEGIKRSVE